MWLGLLWVITMFFALFTTFSFSGNYMQWLTLFLTGLSVLLTARSKRRMAYSWFIAVTSLCLIVDGIRWLI